MALDSKNYRKIYDKLLIDLEKSNDYSIDDIKRILEPVCNFLHIAKLKENIDESLSKTNNIFEYEFVFNEEFDRDSVLIYKENTITDRESDYYFFPEKEYIWDADEKNGIKTLTKLLNIVQGRNRSVRLLNDMNYKETGLDMYNLNYFLKKIGMHIAKGDIENFAICYYNLKRFSLINDRVGRKNGTKVIKMFSDKLGELIGKKGLVCRIGGDNFICYFEKKDVDKVKDFLGGTMINFYSADRRNSVYVEASGGFYVIDDAEKCKQPSDVMDRVSIAFNAAKNFQISSFVFFNEILLQKRKNAKKILGDFKYALKKNEIVAFYQPKVNLKEYRIAGAEVLCRWMKDGQMVPPGEFIPILEASEEICALDYYMLEQVCKDLVRWNKEGREPVRVSVNFSRRHLGTPDLSKKILEIIDKYNISHEYIEIELTETTTDVEYSDLKQLVADLQNHSIMTSVDDFGVGYSSLNLIRELPWDVLKIDKSFVPVTDDKKEQKYIMFKQLIELAQSLGLECIVEGVETIEQVKILKDNNCYMAQGFYFDRPLPVHEFETRLGNVQK